MLFIFVIEIGSELGWVSLNLFYNGVEISQIILIYDIFVKLSRELICDVQYMTL
jgi:hypothetical protein